MGEFTSRSLHIHYYKNTGSDYHLTASTVDGWIEDDHHNYPNNDPAFASHGIVLQDREYGIQRGTTIVRRTGNAVKYIYSGSWRLVAGNQGDYVHSLGHHQMTTTTVAVVSPKIGGGFNVEWAQTAHLWDWYNSDHHADSGLAEIGSDQGANGEEMGLVRPSEVFGESSTMSGMR